MSASGVLNSRILQLGKLQNRFHHLPCNSCGQWRRSLSLYINPFLFPNVSIPGHPVLVDLPCFPTCPTAVILCICCEVLTATQALNHGEEVMKRSWRARMLGYLWMTVVTWTSWGACRKGLLNPQRFRNSGCRFVPHSTSKHLTYGSHGILFRCRPFQLSFKICMDCLTDFRYY